MASTGQASEEFSCSELATPGAIVSGIGLSPQEIIKVVLAERIVIEEGVGRILCAREA
jgi:hypothetical protein